jgi:hypothetical protein
MNESWKRDDVCVYCVHGRFVYATGNPKDAFGIICHETKELVQPFSSLLYYYIVWGILL